MKIAYIKNSITLLFVVVLTMMMSSCNEKLQFDAPNYDPPLAESITPATAPRFSEVVVKGKNLNKVSKVLIGSEEVELKLRVSNTELIIIPNGTHSGKITLLANINNENLEVESDLEFTYQYVAPKISFVPQIVEVGATVILKGENLIAAEDIYVVNNDNTAEKTKAKIVSRLADEILIDIPLISYTSVKMVASYYDGSATVESPLSDGDASEVRIIPPVVPSFTATEIDENADVTVTGTNLNKVTSVYVGGKQVTLVSKVATQLIFKVGIGLFEDGDTPDQTVVIKYFDDQAQMTISNGLTVKVSTILAGRNQIIYGRDKTMGVFRCFYSLELAQAMDNAGFGSVVDPVCVKYLGTGSNSAFTGTPMSAANTLNKAIISEEQYNSVAPYIYIQTTGGGNIQLNGPGNSVGVYRNIWSTETGGLNVIGEKKGSAAACGTPLVMLLPIFPANPDANFVAAKTSIDAAVNAVRTDALEIINADNFPVDVANNTVGGIPLMLSSGLTALSGGPNYDKWTSGLASGADMNLPASNKDGVIMVIYYDYGHSYDPLNPAKGIKKIGFIHVTGLTISPDSGERSKSQIQVNTYFQKRANNPVL